ncbi:MAG: hypothetical protein ACKO7G_07140 [Gammaproteobacteria bacterium]
MMLHSMLVSVVMSAVSLGAPLAVAEPATTRRIAPALDLRLGDIRKFVPAEELEAPLDEAVDEVVVRSPRVRSRLPERMPIPRGVGGLGWLLDHPTQFWRLFVPDPNRAVPNRSIDDPQETPGAHRMRIGEPGRTH